MLEIDPLTKEIGWKYEGTPANPFFSGTRGTVQSLPGGVVFVGSSNDGRMFQVDREGEILWEYWTKEKHRGKVVPIRAKFVTGSLKEAIDVRLAAAGTDAEEEPAGDDKPAADEDGAAASDKKPAKDPAPAKDDGETPATPASKGGKTKAVE